MQHIVGDETLSRPQVVAKDRACFVGEKLRQACPRRRGYPVVAPVNVLFSGAVAHVQCSAGLVIREHGPRDRRPDLTPALDIGGDRHACRVLEGGDVSRIRVAQGDVGDLRIQQGGLSPCRRVLYTVENDGAHPARLRIVIAVGVPTEAAVGIRHVVTSMTVRCDGQLGNTVVTRTQVMVDLFEAEMRGERENRSPVDVGVTAGIDRHICPSAMRMDGCHCRVIQSDQPADLYR